MGRVSLSAEAVALESVAGDQDTIVSTRDIFSCITDRYSNQNGKV